MRALIGSLIGEVEIAVHEGAVLEGLPAGFVGPTAPLTAVPDETAAELGDLTASLPLQRGVVIAPRSNSRSTASTFGSRARSTSTFGRRT